MESAKLENFFLTEKILLSVILISVIFSAGYSTYQDARDKEFTREWRGDIMRRLSDIEAKTYGELRIHNETPK